MRKAGLLMVVLVAGCWLLVAGCSEKAKNTAEGGCATQKNHKQDACATLKKTENRGQKNMGETPMSLIKNNLPKELAGRWGADRNSWEITIEPNGVISSVVHTIGGQKVVAGRVNTYELIRQGEGIVKPGPWSAVYDPNTRILTVEIALEYFKWQVGEQVVEGSSYDIFTGPVSPTWKVWQAEWKAYPEYIVSTDKVQKKRLPVENDEVDEGILIFAKVPDANTATDGTDKSH
jgi:hypothetical protein